jgi:hypothetical protein
MGTGIFSKTLQVIADNMQLGLRSSLTGPLAYTSAGL